VTVRVRFTDLRSVTRALTLPAPISATTALLDVAVDLTRGILADHPDERTITLLAISASNLGDDPYPQIELPFHLPDDGRRPGTRKGLARLRADRAMDAIRDRFGWEAVNYASAAMGDARSVPDAFRSLAEKGL
jgi:DNA polymerase-4